MLGDSVDEVSVHVKKHDAFEKLFATQEDKVALLNDHGSKLLAQNHFESGIISRRLAEVTKRRSVIKEMCMNRRNKLDSAFLHAQFKRDVAEVNILRNNNSYENHRMIILISDFSFF